VRWEVDLALREDIKQRARQLEEALERLEEGDYGICESCGRPIDPERLEILPRTSLCVDCAREAEQDGIAPVIT
jgi:RNA polymerase-binding transcription factor DksA